MESRTEPNRIIENCIELYKITQNYTGFYKIHTREIA